jgi:hypothetical protein
MSRHRDKFDVRMEGVPDMNDATRVTWLLSVKGYYCIRIRITSPEYTMASKQ